MSALWLLGHKTLSDPLTVQEALSGIFGSISLATWIFLLVSVIVACDGVALRIYSFASLYTANGCPGPAAVSELQDWKCRGHLAGFPRCLAHW